MSHYKLLALDIDGTLIRPDQRVAADVASAVTRAAGQGDLRVCLATGRSYAESVAIWRQLDLPRPFEPMILVGGALVSEPDTGRTLYQRSMPRQDACAFADALGETGYVAMVLVDGWRHEVDYYLTETGDVEAAWRQWFSKMPVRTCRVRRLADAPDAPDALRISTVAEPDRARTLAAELRRRFAGRLNVHAIVAPNYGVTIVEAHAAKADKLTALRYVAQSYGLGVGRIAAVGDDINDLSMVRGAGLGVAMPHAPRELLAAANCVVADGLAAFIDRLAGGQYDPA